MGYPLVLPKLSDPRLHLAATITSLQVLGQAAFHFRVSIAQILLCLGTCAAIEIALVARRQHVLMWPASALLTGNGVAFVLRVPGTQHGDWWTMRGWWIFVATAGGSLLSKHVIQWRGTHYFNPSNIGLVVCFLALGRTRAEPLDFWWGPMSWWMALALAIIVTGGFAILRRLHLLRVALTFWASFAAGIGVLALAGHDLTARWHLGPITGVHLWWVLITSPEVLVFLFFMITDPKTTPAGGRARVVYALALGLLAALLIAPTTTEWAAKVALLSALAVVCAIRPLVGLVPRRRVVLAAVGAAAAYPIALVVLGSGPGDASARPLPPGKLPPMTILPSRGVQTQLDLPTAKLIAHDLVATVPARSGETLALHLERGEGQDPPVAVAQLAGRTYRMEQEAGRWQIAAGSAPPQLARVRAVQGYRLADVAQQVGLRFRQGSFRFGVTNDEPAMMGGGVCWIDANEDGRLDLFAVNSYADRNLPDWQDHGGLPSSKLFLQRAGRFVDAGLDLRVRGEGCVAADLDGDGHTDLFVTTAADDVLLWGKGDGTFEVGDQIHSFGWHAGAAVTDVNGDGRLDLFVAGYTDIQHAISGSLKGFPGNYEGVRDELFLNRGHRHFVDVATEAGLDHTPPDHTLGALFWDVDGDGRPDLYVANDEDPNRLYMNVPGGALGFHFVDRGRAAKVDDANAGMGIAAAGPYLFVSNSRRQTHAVYLREAGGFTDVRRAFSPAFGTNLTGWGDAWVDLRNSGSSELVLANGAIPVTSLAKDAAPLQVLAERNGTWADTGLLRSLKLNGRGLAAADYDNDGRVDLAVNTIGGDLVLLHNTSTAGHWLEVGPLEPGTVVTVVDSLGRKWVRTAQAGSSYLSSEDPRLHFGFGAAHVRSLTVRFPGGATRVERNPPVDRIVAVER